MILPLMLFMPPLLKKFSAPQLIAATAVLAAGGYLLNFFAGDNMRLLCVAVTDFLLHLSGYVSSTGEEVVQQSETVIFTILCLYSLIPMFIMLLLAFFAFKLSKLNKQFPEIEKNLAERKGL